MIGCQRGGDWSRRGSLLTRFEKNSDQVVVLDVVTFDRVGIDLADVVSSGVTGKGKALVAIFSMPMKFLDPKFAKKYIYLLKIVFLWHVKKLKEFDKYWLLCSIRSCSRKLIANGTVLGWNLFNSNPRLF